MTEAGGFSRDVKLTKQSIRSKILLRLKLQKEEDRERKSGIIKRKLFKTPVFRKAKTVMFYMSFGGEVNTERMIKDSQKLGKILGVPVCTNSGTIRPVLLQAGVRLKKGPYGICEPETRRFIDLEDLDLVIVPGLAFDLQGRRLGRGKGYYDRFLGALAPKTASLGLAFDFQILPEVPATKHDVSVQDILFA